MTGTRGRRLRARSALELAVLVSWAVRAFLGWLVALPLVSVVASSGIGRLPQADRALFEPGGAWLLETLRKAGGGVGANTGTQIVLLLVAFSLSAVPHALLFSAAAARGTSLGAVFSRSLPRVPRFLLILIVQALLAAIGLVAASLAVSAWAASVPASWSEPAQDLSTVAVLAFALLLVAAVAVVADGARAASTADPRLTLLGSLVRSLAALRAAPFGLGSGYIACFGAGALVVALAARGVELIDVSRPGAGRVVLCWALHQAALLGLCALQAAWVLRVTAVVRPPSLGDARLAEHTPVDLHVATSRAIPGEVAAHDAPP